jgi:hypothetical protein
MRSSGDAGAGLGGEERPPCETNGSRRFRSSSSSGSGAGARRRRCFAARRKSSCSLIAANANTGRTIIRRRGRPRIFRRIFFTAFVPAAYERGASGARPSLTEALAAQSLPWPCDFAEVPDSTRTSVRLDIA